MYMHLILQFHGQFHIPKSNNLQKCTSFSKSINIPEKSCRNDQMCGNLNRRAARFIVHTNTNSADLVEAATSTETPNKRRNWTEVENVLLLQPISADTPF